MNKVNTDENIIVTSRTSELHNKLKDKMMNTMRVKGVSKELKKEEQRPSNTDLPMQIYKQEAS
jgi:hypothetical protein